jgi:hypothetical protein
LDVCFATRVAGCHHLRFERVEALRSGSGQDGEEGILAYCPVALRSFIEALGRPL